MDNNEIKKANRKALPKFMLIMVISLLIGGLGGFCSAKYGLNSLSDGMKSAGAFFSAYIAPWLMLAAAVILPVVCIPIYRSTKKLISSWDGENAMAAEMLKGIFGMFGSALNTAMDTPEGKQLLSDSIKKSRENTTEK